MPLNRQNSSHILFVLALTLGATACGDAASSDTDCTTVAACDGSNGDSKTGKSDTMGDWEAEVIETLDSEGDVGDDTAIAVDDLGRVHLTYYDSTKGDLRYLNYDGSRWLPPVALDTDGDVGAASSMALGAAGAVHVTYYDATNKVLKYVHFDGEAWQRPQNPTRQTATGEESALAVDSQGQVHVVCSAGLTSTDRRSLSTDLIYLRFDGESWTEPTDLDESGANMVDKPAIAVDATDQIHVVYPDSIDEELKYTHSIGSEWSEPVVIDSAEFWGDVDIAIADRGHLHVAYWAEVHSWFSSDQEVRHMRFDGDTWSEPASLYDGKNGHDVSIDTYQESAYVSYFDPEAGSLALTIFDGQAWTGPTLLDGHAQSVGSANSLAVDTAGGVHISYYDEANKDLKYYRHAQ